MYNLTITDCGQAAKMAIARADLGGETGGKLNSHHFTFLKFENPSSGSKVTDISITGVKYPYILI